MAAQIKASGSSETLTTTETETSGRQGLVLKLKVKPKPSAQSAVEQQGGQQGVTWDEGVVDNEFMNKKSSKQCCIFHKPRQFGESDSDESDSDWEGFDGGGAPRRKEDGESGNSGVGGSQPPEK